MDFVEVHVGVEQGDEPADRRDHAVPEARPEPGHTVATRRVLGRVGSGAAGDKQKHEDHGDEKNNFLHSTTLLLANTKVDRNLI